MEGFGIVTLASLFPVLAVELMAIGLSLTYTREEVCPFFVRRHCRCGLSLTYTREVVCIFFILRQYRCISVICAGLGECGLWIASQTRTCQGMVVCEIHGHCCLMLPVLAIKQPDI